MTTAVARPAGRQIRHTDLIPDAATESRRLGGYAVVWDSPSVDIGFRETIKRGAFRDTLANPDHDVCLFWGHDSRQVLARQSAGNLRIREDAHGLAWEADLPDTQLARDALELVRKRIVKGCSFGFIPSRADEVEEFHGDELWVTVNRVRELTELSMTPIPAYPATSVEARNRAAARGRLALKPRSPYRPDAPYSYFRDRIVVHEAERRAQAAASVIRDPNPDHFGDGLHDRIHGGVLEARQRLNAHMAANAAELRDVSTAAFAGLIPKTLPPSLRDAFATAARARGTLAAALRREPLPEKGLTIQGTKLGTGTSVDLSPAENSAPSESAPSGTSIESPVGWIDGFVDVSRQTWERAGGNGHTFDVGIATDLGAATAAKLDVSLITGTGSAPQPLGLTQVSGITTTAYTDASPTCAEFWAKLMSCYATVGTTSGYPPDTIVLHGRRFAWLNAWADTAGALVPLRWPEGVKVVVCNSIPTTLGGGTEDEVLLLASQELPYFTDDVAILISDQTLGPQTIRVGSWQYVATLFSRSPESIGVVSGTGLAAPTF